MKEEKKTIADFDNAIQGIEKRLKQECSVCEGTGSPRTKTGKLPKSGKGTAKCKSCSGTGFLGFRIDNLESDIQLLKKNIKRISDQLDAYINRQYVEIKVLPKGHSPKRQGHKAKGWENYSGRFHISNKETEEALIEKARDHFHKYFEDGAYHRNKRLGLFLSSTKTSRLIEEMITD